MGRLSSGIDSIRNKLSIRTSSSKDETSDAGTGRAAKRLSSAAVDSASTGDRTSSSGSIPPRALNPKIATSASAGFSQSWSQMQISTLDANIQNLREVIQKLTPEQRAFNQSKIENAVKLLDSADEMNNGLKKISEFINDKKPTLDVSNRTPKKSRGEGNTMPDAAKSLIKEIETLTSASISSLSPEKVQADLEAALKEINPTDIEDSIADSWNDFLAAQVAIFEITRKEVMYESGRVDMVNSPETH
jgi:hypothetical protein